LPIQYPCGRGGAGGIALLKVLVAAVVIAADTAGANAAAAFVVGGTDALSVVSREDVML
jgi:hypothetical protein